MYKVKETIIVEGRYDKIKLSGFIDGIIIATGGFSVFKNENLKKTIKELAEKTGIVILTDSDSAGFRIRNYIKQNIGCDVKHAYIPDVKGKEKRKREPGREGLLGVEGMNENIIIDALRKAGCTINNSEYIPRTEREITKSDLMKYGLAGGNGSAELRKKISYKLNLPAKLSANMLLDILNRILTYDEFIKLVTDLKQ